MMKTYRGERTEHGCKVTVNGSPLRVRSDLSGSATAPFDWGYIVSGQLSLALLSDFFCSDRKAKAMFEVFERQVIAGLPDCWTMTERDLAGFLAPLVGVDGARADDPDFGGDSSTAFGDMPVAGTLQAEDAAAAAAMLNEGGHLAGL